jgi:ribosomal protein L11 methylase PrmA
MILPAILIGFTILVLVGSTLLIFYFVFLIIGAISAGIYVPTEKNLVEKVVELSGVRSGEKMIDLGSGDGRLLIAFAKRGATAIGYEINPFLVMLSRIKAKQSGVGDRIKVIRRNLWKGDISEADIVAIYLIDFRMPALENKLKKELKPGSRIVSVGFQFPNWQPVKIFEDKVFLYQKD